MHSTLAHVREPVYFAYAQKVKMAKMPTKMTKLHFFCIFFEKYLVMSKKSSTFARFFVGSVSTR